MFAIFHNGKRSVMGVHKVAHGLNICKIVIFSIKYFGGSVPIDWIISNIAQILPRKSFSKFCRNFLLLL